MERVADYVIRKLAENNIDHIFLITGRGILYLTDAVAKNTNIKGVSTYHEQGASYAAMAYAAARDGMGACLVSTGCAAANAVTAVLCAYQDNLPVVFISGQHMLNETIRYTKSPIRTFGSQEADIVSIVEPITKYVVMLTNPADVKKEIDKAFYLANEGRKGPVWIDIPLDIQNARIEADELSGWNVPERLQCFSEEDLEYVVRGLENAKRPIVFIGGGVRSAGAISCVAELIENYNIPAVFSASAADAYGTGNRLSVGAVGSLGGSRAGNIAVQNSDFVLCLGSKLCSQTTGQADQFAREARIVVIDIDPLEHTKKGVHIDKVIHADIKDYIEKLLLKNIVLSTDAWVSKCIHWKDRFSIDKERFITEYLKKNIIDLYYFADTLSGILPGDATVITDAGFEELIIPSTIRYEKYQRCLFPASQGAMGYAIPAILGAYYAGKKSIIAVVGDGSFMMNMQELLAISKSDIPVKMFVINNNMYSVIRKRQQDLFRKRTIGNDPSDGLAAPDFHKIADCFDFDYFILNDPNQLEDDIGNVIESDKTCICEVICAEDQKYLHTSFAINEARKLVKRPLEDLAPFMDREILCEEMIVETVQE